MYNAILAVVMVPSLFCIFGRFYTTSKEYTELFAKFSALYFLSLAVLTLATYQKAALGLIGQIYRYHHMAFQSHFKSLVVLFVATELGLLSLSFFSGVNCLVTFCVFDGEAMNGGFKEDEGICPWLFPNKFDMPLLSRVEMGNTMSVLLPVFTFLLLSDPHDCYVCLGKDPDRKYSIH